MLFALFFFAVAILLVVVGICFFVAVVQFAWHVAIGLLKAGMALVGIGLAGAVFHYVSQWF